MSEKITKEGWMEWLKKKAGPEMILAAIMELTNDPDKMIDSIFEYAKEIQEKEAKG